MRRRPTGGLRVDGLRLIIVSVSAVGLFTTYSALEIYRFGDLSASLRTQIAESAQRADALARAGTVVSDKVAFAEAVAAVAATEGADAEAVERLRSGTAEDRALRVAELAATEAARRDGLVTLWGEASADLSHSLSVSLASIVVLLFTVVLRSLAYLSARDRTEAQLRRARADAEAANAAKSDFLATMSHEIRTPLTAIKGYAELLGSGPLDVRQRDELGKLRDAGEVLGVLIDDILDLAKIEAGRIDLHRDAVDLRALAERVIALVRPTAAAKGLALGCSISPDVPRFVQGDTGRLLQVLLNLTNNAVKFTGKGGVSLSVTRDEGRLSLAVSDTGIGIAPADVPRLFKRFSQIDSSLTRAHAGSGLGLAISRGLVERMGGEIGVESTYGEGSRFTVILPLVEAAEAADDPAPAGVRGAARPARGAARVLVVEDSVQNQDLIGAVLERAGHRCTRAMDGIEGLEAARSGAYDLVIMDMQMPRMDGIAATAAIRALSGAAGKVPVLALSANALPDQVAAMARAGAGRHLAKPFALDDLTATVEAMVAAADATDAAALSPPTATGPSAEGALAELAALLGGDWVQARLRAVLRDFDWVADETEPSALRIKAHRLVSDAGQLGLPALAEAALALEEAIDAGADLTQARTLLAREAANAEALLPALLARVSKV